MNLYCAWSRLHRRPAWPRWSAKLMLFALAVGLVLYPKVWLLPTWVGRVHDLRSVIDPDHPGLTPLAERVRAELPAEAELSDVARAVELIVYDRVPYAWDWETWGVMDYLPTVDEVLACGREDCDGRAVVAASLLQNLGYEALLVTDLQHMWVVTSDREAESPQQHEFMSPGAGEKTLVASADGGTRARLDWGTIRNIGRAMSFGVAVFPLGRELLILLAAVALTLHPRMRFWRGLAGGALLLLMLVFLRRAGSGPGPLAEEPMLSYAGLCLGVAGWLLIAWPGRRPSGSKTTAGNDRSG